jgi:glycosyltransferase involved in cell wall biosynthesis
MRRNPGITDKSKRVFWLGMHAVLTKTELPRLRSLGYEVYNPPYNSKVYDQSANMDWDKDQHTTLAKEIFNELSCYNFFYNPISPRIAEILNEYFGTVIVTINPDWLTEILRVYKGRLIYRVYGQIGTLSEALWARECFRAIQERDDFWLVPHSEEAVSNEHDWLKERMYVVPYTLPLDVFDHRDTWGKGGPIMPFVMASCPNIDNAYYKHQYERINRDFRQPFLKIYGVQPRRVDDDSRVVGTIPRVQLLNDYKRASGYLYVYTERNVCYLPPLEMMTIGGPVLYFPNSLLARYFGTNCPGVVQDPTDADKKMRSLLTEDKVFLQEVIESQREVRKRYSPEYVHPIFDSVFTRLLDVKTHARSMPVILNLDAQQTHSNKRIYVLFHFPGSIILFSEGHYSSAEGIPRVVAKIIDALLEGTDYEIVVTCKSSQLQEVHGFFLRNRVAGRIKFLLCDPERLVFRWKSRLRIILAGSVIYLLVSSLKRSARKLARFVKLRARARWIRHARHSVRRALSLLLATEMIHYINRYSEATSVLVPHYYHFPESLFLKQNLVLYLPDYTPHLVPEGFSGYEEKINAWIGKIICTKAKVIITNAQFTKTYLPETALQVSAEKIHVVPIPFLMPKYKALDATEERKLTSLLGGELFILYPTQNRPNKQIAFLLRVFKRVLDARPKLKLVLTCNLDDYQPARQVYDKERLQESILFVSHVSDSALAWLYQHARALCLTSTMEGNFPPQVLEALAFRTPIVATRLPFFEESLGIAANNLLLCQPFDLDAFAQSLLFAIEQPEVVRTRQAIAYEKVMERCGESQFKASIIELFATFGMNMQEDQIRTSTVAKLEAGDRD